MRFKDREHAGRLLAARLTHLRATNPVVLGLTHGGLPVAFEVAHGLDAPLDLVVVKKLRAAADPELPFGALAEGGVTYLNPTLLRDARMTRETAADVAEEMVAELARNVRLYRGEETAPSLRGRAVIIVDDYVATGASACAAAMAARQRGAMRVILAVPVLAASAEAELWSAFDDIVALAMTQPTHPATEAYERLEEIDEDAALEYLRRSRFELQAERVEPAGLT